jgi:hypothetical protein
LFGHQTFPGIINREPGNNASHRYQHTKKYIAQGHAGSCLLHYSMESKMFVTKSFILTREKQGKFIFFWHCLGRKGLNTPLEQKIHQKFRKNQTKIRNI